MVVHQTDLTRQTALPNPLPTPTKANNVFAGWYLDSSFTQKAVAGATIESNVTLYAKGGIHRWLVKILQML